MISSDRIRRYLYAALEFVAYTVLLAFLGGAVYVMMRYHPDDQGSWYVTLCIVAGGVSGAYALWEYRRYRIAARRLAARARHAPAPRETPAEARARRRRLLWSERIGATPVSGSEREPVSAEAMAQMRAELAAPDEAGEGAMSLDAIRARIAERMAREDAERDAAEQRERRARRKYD